MHVRRSARIALQAGNAAAALAAELVTQLEVQKRTKKPLKDPKVFYIAYGEPHIGIDKGYCPGYIGQDPLVQPIDDDLDEEDLEDEPMDSGLSECFSSYLHPLVRNVFTDLPTELLVEILVLLEPSDLLHLCRAVKFLRHMLQTEGTSKIWQAAFNNAPKEIRLPTIPDNCDPLHFTALLYDKECPYCDYSVDVHHEFPSLTQCRLTGEEPRRIETTGLDAKIVRLCSTVRRVTTDVMGPSVLQSEYLVHRKQYISLMSDRAQLYCYVMARFKEKRAQIELNKRVLESRSMIQYQRSTIIPRRIEAIRERFAKEGYTRFTNFAPEGFWDKPPVLVGHALTQEEWQTIRADCLLHAYPAFVNDRKRHFPKAFARYLHILGEYLSGIEGTDQIIYPLAIYVAQAEPFCSMIKKTQGYGLLVARDFRNLDEEAKPIIAEWRSKADEALRSLVPKSFCGVLVDNSSDDLSCATVVFKCTLCDDTIVYPAALEHSCFKKQDDKRLSRYMLVKDKEWIAFGENGKLGPPLLKTITFESEWSALFGLYRASAGLKGIVSFDVKTAHATKGALLACGEDPLQITHQEMAGKDYRLECVRCCQEKPVVMVNGVQQQSALCMTLNRAIQHAISVHTTKDEQWDLVTLQEELTKIKEVEVLNDRCGTTSSKTDPDPVSILRRRVH